MLGICTSPHDHDTVMPCLTTDGYCGLAQYSSRVPRGSMMKANAVGPVRPTLLTEKKAERQNAPLLPSPFLLLFRFCMIGSPSLCCSREPF